MDNTEEIKNTTPSLKYNTQKRRLQLPEYGRNVQKMIDYVKSIPDREERNRQARAVIEVMETVNPQVHLQEDSPYPAPKPEELSTPPVDIKIRRTPVKIAHYGKNIENIINLIAEKEDGEAKDAMIRSIALYMRQQFLIWNKDSVSDETIFNDIVKLSGGRIKIPEGLHLNRISGDQNFSRPGVSGMKSRNMLRQKSNRQKNNRK